VEVSSCSLKFSGGSTERQKGITVTDNFAKLLIPERVITHNVFVTFDVCLRAQQ
jgi:hypothetical protein